MSFDILVAKINYLSLTEQGPTCGQLICVNDQALHVLLISIDMIFDF